MIMLFSTNMMRMFIIKFYWRHSRFSKSKKIFPRLLISAGECEDRTQFAKEGYDGTAYYNKSLVTRIDLNQRGIIMSEYSRTGRFLSRKQSP